MKLTALRTWLKPRASDKVRAHRYPRQREQYLLVEFAEGWAIVMWRSPTIHLHVGYERPRMETLRDLMNLAYNMGFNDCAEEGLRS